MKRSQTIALITMLSLIAIASTMGAMTVYSGLFFDRGYLNIALLAGTAAALSQLFVAVLAYWGLSLTRQSYDLSAIPGENTGAGNETQTSSLSGFRMSAPDDVTDDQFRRSRNAATGAVAGRVLGHIGGHAGGLIGAIAGAAIGGAVTTRRTGDDQFTEVRTLESGFQRTIVIFAASFMMLVAIAISYLLLRQYNLYKYDPSQAFHIVRVDPLIFTIVAGAAGGYFALFTLARVRKETEGFGEAISGLLTLALPGAIAVAVGITLAWAGVAYAAEFAAGVVVFILVIQSLELFVNAVRSYSGVEELDQDPVDLQSTPLIPMLSSVWINGLRMLMGQSFGVTTSSEKGVIARMMPRVFAALIILAVAVSCIHVVPAGHMAVLERFGSVEGYSEGCEGIRKGLLDPGVHILLPWPMDRLVLIPDKRLQQSDVGAELQQREGMEDLELWNVPHAKANDDGQFITGNVNKDGKLVGRILESYGTVWWRVSDPGKYYMALSHQDAFEAVTSAPGTNEPTGTTALPMNQLIISRIANRALTRAYAEVDGDAVMISGRQHLEERIRYFMERDLEKLDAGIEVVSITINDMHPPFGSPNPALGIYGPAGAYEDVVAAEQDRQTIKHMANLDANNRVTAGLIKKTTELTEASAYNKTKILNAEANAGYQRGTIEGFREYPYAAESRQRFMDLMDALAPNQKVLVGPGVEPPIIIQQNKGGGISVPLGN